MSINQSITQIKAYWGEQLIPLSSGATSALKLSSDYSVFLKNIGIPVDNHLNTYHAKPSVKMVLHPQEAYSLTLNNKRFIVIGYYQKVYFRFFLVIEREIGHISLVFAHQLSNVKFVNTDIIKFLLCLKSYLELLPKLRPLWNILDDDMLEMERNERVKYRRQLGADVKILLDNLQEKIQVTDANAFVDPLSFWSERFTDWRLNS